MLDRLLLQPGELPADYKRRYLALTRLKPIIEASEDAETEAILRALGESSDDPDGVTSELVDYFMGDSGEADFQAVYRLGVVMLLNYVQLYRHVGTLEAIEDLEHALGRDADDKSAAERIASNIMTVLEDKSERAARLVVDNEGNRDNIYATDAFRGLGANATALKEVRSAQAEISKAKVAALQARDKSLEYLRQVADNERRLGK